VTRSKGNQKLGTLMAGIARSVRTHVLAVAPSAVLLSGGETTVTIGRDGAGKGGRNTEFLLGFAVANQARRPVEDAHCAAVGGGTCPISRSAHRRMGGRRIPRRSHGGILAWPRSLAALRPSRVRLAIISRSCSATAASTWMVGLVASGVSQQTKSTLPSISFAMNAPLRASRSSGR